MTKTRVALLVAMLVAGVAALAGCGPTSGSDAASPSPSATVRGTAGDVRSLAFTPGTAKDNNAPSNTGDFYHGPSDSPAAEQWVQLSAGAVGDLNPVVLNGDGFLLYRFDKDTPQPSASNCKGDCAKTWPPVLIKPGGRVFLDGVAKTKVGLLKRDDGSLQLTIGGWPLYKYSKDTASGQANGQGVGGTWFGVTPDGTKAASSAQGPDSATGLDYENGTAGQHNAPKNTGDNYQGKRSDPPAMKWVQLTSGSANGLNPLVHDARGFTLYRFDKDSRFPSKSACGGSCAETWPPVLVATGGRIFVDGVPTAQIGILKRGDGTRQVTIGGRPVYRYTGDTAPRETNGEGVGKTWYAVSPTGGKVLPTKADTPPTAGAPVTSSASPSAPGSGTVALGNGSVILDSGKNFAEPKGSTATAGPGCQNLTSPFTALSLQLSGGPIKLWSGKGCTGNSAVVSASVTDLSTVFPHAVAAVKFGS